MDEKLLIGSRHWVVPVYIDEVKTNLWLRADLEVAAVVAYVEIEFTWCKVAAAWLVYDKQNNPHSWQTTMREEFN